MACIFPHTDVAVETGTKILQQRMSSLHLLYVHMYVQMWDDFYTQVEKEVFISLMCELINIIVQTKFIDMDVFSVCTYVR
jgi:hypothetical protein